PRGLRLDSRQAVVKYVRFERMGVERYGIWEDDRVKELDRSPLSGVRETGREFLRSEVRFLVPCLPSKVLAVGLNYASHREHVERSEGVIRNAAGRPVPSHEPGVFAKFPSSLVPHGADVELPEGATNVHFEGELALVIGR